MDKMLFRSTINSVMSKHWRKYTSSWISQKSQIHGHRNHDQLEMWPNAQRDGRPAEFRWRPLFNTAVWLTPTTTVPCSNAAKTQNPLKFAWVPQTGQPISAASMLKFTILWEHVKEILPLKFFPIVDTCLSCKDIARQSCVMVPRWQFFGDFFACCNFSEPCTARFRPAF